MKVVIFTEGNTDLGLGHIARCIALSQAFEFEGSPCKIFAFGNEAADSLLSEYNHEMVDWIDNPIIIQKLIGEADAVIMDSMMASNTSLDCILNIAKIPIFIDDSFRLKYPRGIVINRTIFAEKMTTYKNTRVTYLLGTKYLPLDLVYRNTIKPKIRNVVSNLAITFGGSDPRGLTPIVIDYLCKSFPDIIFKVIIGKAYKSPNSLNKVKKRNVRMFFSLGPEEMKKTLLSCDIVISSGGQTLYELARIGLPTISIEIVENQRKNIIGFEKAGFVENAGKYNDDQLLVNLLTKVSKLLPQETRLKRSIIGSKLVDGLGSLRVANIVTGAYHALSNNL